MITACPVFTKKDIDEIKGIVSDAHEKWFMIGKELKVSKTIIGKIKSQCEDSHDCLNELINQYLKRYESLKSLIAALKSRNMLNIAEQLQGKSSLV